MIIFDFYPQKFEFDVSGISYYLLSATITLCSKSDQISTPDIAHFATIAHQGLNLVNFRATLFRSASKKEKAVPFPWSFLELK